MNIGSLKHVTETLKNAERNPRPSGDLIPRNMQSRHAPEEPQQPGSVIFSAFDLYLIIDFLPSRGFIKINAIPLKLKFLSQVKELWFWKVVKDCKASIIIIFHLPTTKSLVWRHPPLRKSKGLVKYKYLIISKGIQLDSKRNACYVR